MSSHESRHEHTDEQVMAAYAILVDAGWLPPKRNGTVDDVRHALTAAESQPRSDGDSRA